MRDDIGVLLSITCGGIAMLLIGPNGELEFGYFVAVGSGLVSVCVTRLLEYGERKHKEASE